MEINELKALKTAIKSVKTELDTLAFSGKDFSCRWNGSSFVWIAPSGQSYNISSKDAVKWLHIGEDVTNHCFSYGDLPEVQA